MGKVGRDENKEREQAVCVEERISRGELLALIESQGYKCALTGELLTPSTASVDHAIPLARGGDHSIQNCIIVLGSVNAAKGTMTVDEFVDMCRKVANHSWAKTSR